MQLALASFAPVWEDKVSSLECCRELAVRAAGYSSELLLFPELTLTGFTMNATFIAEPPDASPTISAFARMASEQRLAIGFGVALQGRDRPTNCMVLVDRTGAELARYAKAHLFSPSGEDRHYDSGEGIAVTAVADVACGLSICYDLRFPELYTSMAERTQALLVIASWPAPRIAHWYALLQARAIECQCYVVGVNRIGTDGNGLDYPASSRVFDPAGARLTPEWTDGELEGYSIAAGRVVEQRGQFPVLRDRRPGLYRRL